MAIRVLESQPLHARLARTHNRRGECLRMRLFPVLLLVSRVTVPITAERSFFVTAAGQSRHVLKHGHFFSFSATFGDSECICGGIPEHLMPSACFFLSGWRFSERFFHVLFRCVCACLLLCMPCSAGQSVCAFSKICALFPWTVCVCSCIFTSVQNRESPFFERNMTSPSLL